MAKPLNKVLNIVGMGVPDAPKMEEPEAAPVANDAASRAAAEREMQRRRAGKGRVGTILSENSKLG